MILLFRLRTANRFCRVARPQPGKDAEYPDHLDKRPHREARARLSIFAFQTRLLSASRSDTWNDPSSA